MKTPRGRFVKYEGLGSYPNYRGRMTCSDHSIVLARRGDGQVDVEIPDAGTLGCFPSWKEAKTEALAQLDRWMDVKDARRISAFE